MDKVPSSRIFSPFRALGYCTNHVPLCTRIHTKSNESYLITCVGKAFHTYNTSKLRINSVSNSHPEPIRCLATDGFLVFTACDTDIRAFSRGKHVCHMYKGHESPVHLLLPFGDHLISVDENSLVKVWDIGSEKVYMELTFDNATFTVTALVHPSTYVNKILLGSEQGEMQLWNVRTAKLLFTFYGWGHGVTVLEQAPAIDVIAVGLSSGDIYLHNVKFDETVVKFHQEWGPVTAVSFRTDGPAVMTSASPLGHIAVWDLEKKRLLGQMREAHSGAVTGMKCLPSEPLMVTTSSDNAIKIWIFDQPDGSGRLLRERSGHSAPPTKIMFHGTGGGEIISAGQDSTLRLFSTVHEGANRSFGRASSNKAKTKKTGLKNDEYMMTPIINFTTEASRASDWDCIVACHRGERRVTTWNYDRHTMGKYKLMHPRFTQKQDQFLNATAQSCEITSCGNFCVLGYSTGHVDVYNLQSGLHRGALGRPKAHDGSVRGVNVDVLNTYIVTAGADSRVKFWRFKKKSHVTTLEMAAPAAATVLHRESGLLAVILDDFSVSLIDVETTSVVRQFSGHDNRITDVSFSSDARWLVTASMDCTVRTWDVPTGSLIDAFLVSSACTSACLSPSGEYLATTHVDDVGVHLWSNQALYAHLDLRPLPENYEPRLLALPASRRQTQETAEETSEMEEEVSSGFKSPEQISHELVTLSSLANSRWQNLLNLDVIRQRNKPKEPPRAPKSAPFFIPTIPGLEVKFAPAPSEETTQEDKETNVPSHLLSLTPFGTMVEKAETNEQYVALLRTMEGMGPSAIDREIRCLCPSEGASHHVMGNFLRYIKYLLSTNNNYQLAHAYLGLFIKIHGDEIRQSSELISCLKDLYELQNESWSRLEGKINRALCLVNYLKSATV